jgi:hypothetical protein
VRGMGLFARSRVGSTTQLGLPASLPTDSKVIASSLPFREGFSIFHRA